MSSGDKPRLAGRRLVRALLRLLRIYWTSPDARRGALLLLGAAALELGAVRAMLLVADAQGVTWDALESREASRFFGSIGLLLGAMGLYVVAATYRIFIRQILEVRWRQALTAHFLGRWMSEQAYCQNEFHRDEIDNPDQRIAEDVREFVASALGLSLSLLSAVATLAMFGGLLWNLSRDWPLHVDASPLVIPGFMFWVALGFALASTWLTHLVGRRLVPINFDRLHFEADFRYGLMRFRDNVESAILSHGQEAERQGSLGRFRQVVGNFWQLIRAQRRLNLFTTSIGQVNEIMPLLLAAPFYFSRLITLGAIAQTRIAYAQVAAALTWFVNAYQEIARWRAGIERLTSLAEMMDQTEREIATAGVRIEPAPNGALRLHDLALELPRGRVLIEAANAEIAPGEHVAVLGPSGAGKTLLMRALAGIWRFGSGKIELPAGVRTLFLPQWPYLPLGTLRAAVSFPAEEGHFGDERIQEALRALGLGHLVPVLDESAQWDQRLSPHEQQRVALARVLLHEPDWAFLDKATSALDRDMEKRVYELLAERLPKLTLLTVAHHPEVAAYHDRRWVLSPVDGGRVALRVA